MDFADATLVRIAERESLSLILTIDHDDFETYRIQGRRRFRIVPGRTLGSSGKLDAFYCVAINFTNPHTDLLTAPANRWLIVRSKIIHS